VKIVFEKPHFVSPIYIEGDEKFEIFELERKRFIDADYADFKDFMF